MLGILSYLWKIIKLVILLALIGFVSIFFINNSQNVSVSLNPFPYEMDIKLFLLITLFFVFGLLCGFLIGSKIILKNKISELRKKWEIKRLEKLIKKGSQNEKIDSEL